MAEIRILPKGPNAEVIKHLELLIEQAKAGELVAVASVVQYDDGSVDHGWRMDTRNMQTRRMMGEMFVMQTRFATELIEIDGDG